jgi:3-oxoacyl-[acyl-carrier protein] reductase
MGNEVACITGAGKGIGKELAIHLSKQGYDLACCSRTKGDLIDLEREATCSRIITDSADVSIFEQVSSFADRVADEYQKIDILVINAGITTQDLSVEDSNIRDWVNVVDINLIGAYYTAKCFIPLLRKSNRGRIILIGSGLGHRGQKGTSAYSCSKAGLLMLMSVLAEELVDCGITVNELIPGPVNTSIDDGKKKQHSSIRIQTEWYKETKDVLPLFDFLINQPQTGPTGQTFSMTRREI